MSDLLAVHLWVPTLMHFSMCLFVSFVLLVESSIQYVRWLISVHFAKPPLFIEVKLLFSFLGQYFSRADYIY